MDSVLNLHGRHTQEDTDDHVAAMQKKFLQEGVVLVEKCLNVAGTGQDNVRQGDENNV